MTVKTSTNMVTRQVFDGRWDALWSGWYTNQDRGEFTIQIERLARGPHVTVTLKAMDIQALRDRFGPGEEEGAVVVLGGVLEIDGREKTDGYDRFDMAAIRRPLGPGALVLQAIGEDVWLEISDADWVACRQRLGIGQSLEGADEAT